MRKRLQNAWICEQNQIWFILLYNKRGAKRTCTHIFKYTAWVNSNRRGWFVFTDCCWLLQRVLWSSDSHAACCPHLFLKERRWRARQYLRPWMSYSLCCTVSPLLGLSLTLGRKDLIDLNQVLTNSSHQSVIANGCAIKSSLTVLYDGPCVQRTNPINTPALWAASVSVGGPEACFFSLCASILNMCASVRAGTCTVF